MSNKLEVPEHIHNDMSKLVVQMFKEIDRIDKKYSDKFVEFAYDIKWFNIRTGEVFDEYTWKLAGDEK